MEHLRDIKNFKAVRTLRFPFKDIYYDQEVDKNEYLLNDYKKLLQNAQKHSANPKAN